MFSVSKLIHRNTLLLIFLGIVLLMGNMNGFITMVTMWALLVIIFLPIYKYIDLQGVVLFVFSLLYILFGSINGFVSSSHQVVLYLIPIVFYLFGAYIYKYISSEKTILSLICLMLFLYSLEVYITIISKVISTGSIVNTSRLFYFHGDQSRQLTATFVGLNVSVGLVGFPMFIILNKYKILRFLFLGVGLLSLMTTLYLVNRSGIVIVLICICAVVYYVYRRQGLKYLLILSLLVGVYFLIQKIGLIDADILDAYSIRNEKDLLTVGDRPRRWMEAISELIKHPFGWAEDNGSTTYYVHNMWLDMAKVSGIFPFLMIVWATILSIKHMIQLFKIEKDYVAAVLIGLNICFLASCFIEPVYGGLHFFLYVMTWGIVNSYLRVRRLR